MLKYHIRNDGTPAVCIAKTGNCPVSSVENHYPSKGAARNAYEDIQKNEQLANRVSKHADSVEITQLTEEDSSRYQKGHNVGNYQVSTVSMPRVSSKGHREIVAETTIIDKEGNEVDGWRTTGDDYSISEINHQRGVTRAIELSLEK